MNKKLSPSEKEIFEDLFKILNKMAAMEFKEGKQIFSDETLEHISYAMESVSGIKGITERIRSTQDKLDSVAGMILDKSKN